MLFHSLNSFAEPARVHTSNAISAAIHRINTKFSTWIVSIWNIIKYIYFSSQSYYIHKTHFVGWEELMCVVYIVSCALHIEHCIVFEIVYRAHRMAIHGDYEYRIKRHRHDRSERVTFVLKLHNICIYWNLFHAYHHKYQLNEWIIYAVSMCFFFFFFFSFSNVVVVVVLVDDGFLAIWRFSSFTVCEE